MELRWGMGYKSTCNYVMLVHIQYSAQVRYLRKVSVRQFANQTWIITQNDAKYSTCKADMFFFLFFPPVERNFLPQRQARNLAVLLKQSLPAGSTAGTAARLREAEAPRW